MTRYTDGEIEEQEKEYRETYDASITIGWDIQDAKEAAENAKAHIRRRHDAAIEDDQRFRLINEVTGRSNSVLNT
jgi:hypothetical protein